MNAWQDGGSGLSSPGLTIGREKRAFPGDPSVRQDTQVGTNQPSGGPPEAGRRPGGEVIALLIMGIGLLTTGFFTGWTYFRVQEGFGPAKGKEKSQPMAVVPLGTGDDAISLLGEGNLSWKVLAPKGKAGLILSFDGKPNQGITVELPPGEGPARLILIRQEIAPGEEGWTLALGRIESPSQTDRKSIRVKTRPGEKPIVRSGGIPLSQTKEAELAMMRWVPPSEGNHEGPIQASLVWYPPQNP